MEFEKLIIPKHKGYQKTFMDTKLKKSLSQDETDRFAIETCMEEKTFGTSLVESAPGKKNQDSYEELDEAHHWPQTTCTAKTTDPSMRSWPESLIE